MHRIPLFSTTFAEGRLFDLWMLVHFLAGTTGGFANVWLRLAPGRVYLLGLVLMLLWEALEYGAGVRESIENRLLDVGIGMAGVALALSLSRGLGTGGEHLAFGISGTLLAAGNYLGWRAYRRRISLPPSDVR